MRLIIGKKKVYAYEVILFFMMTTCSMLNLQINGKYFFIYLQIMFCLLMIFNNRNILFFSYPIINFLFISISISAICAQFSDIRDSYKTATLVITLFLIPLYFTASYLSKLIKNDKDILRIFVSGIKVMCIIQLAWIPLQYIAYHVFGVDINEKIFLEILQCTQNLSRTSFYRSWEYYPSGITWHSAILAPMFVIAFVLFENLYVRLLICIDVFLCGNSTAVVGVIIVSIFLLVQHFSSSSNFRKIKRSKLLSLILFVGVVVSVCTKSGILDIALDKIFYLYNRLTDVNSDASTMAHLSYYVDYPKVCEHSSIIQVLFGYGPGCSGYPFSEMYDLYSSLGNWSVECDVMDILISRGIVGFIGYYYFLFYICLNGRKLDKRYFIIMFTFIVQGLGYNIQFDYVFLIEIIMFITIKLKINLFAFDK